MKPGFRWSTILAPAGSIISGCLSLRGGVKSIKPCWGRAPVRDAGSSHGALGLSHPHSAPSHTSPRDSCGGCLRHGRDPGNL